MHLPILVWWLLVVGVAHCEESLFEAWRAHSQRVSPTRFPCKQPQARTMLVKELLKQMVSEKKFSNETWMEIQNFTILPHRTVLHTCSSAGSCRVGSSCQMEHSHDVLLVFTMTNPNVQGNLEYLSITASNHTSCKCQKDDNTPK